MTAEAVQISSYIETWNEIIDDVNNGRVRIRQGFECSQCYNSGFRYVPDPQGSKYRGVVRCNECRYWEFEAERMRQQRGYQAI
jgi:hypothetical protein